MLEIFFIIFVILITARVLGDAMEHVRMPSMLGELLAGVLLSVLFVILPWSPLQAADILGYEGFNTIVNLGIFFLMLLAGMEVSLKKLIQSSKTGIPVALGGAILPFLLGYGVGSVFIPDSDYKFLQVLFLGVALSITAIPVSVRALRDIGHLHTRVGTTIINAALIDDIIGLVMLAFLTSMLRDGGTLSGVPFIAGRVALFFLAALFIGRYIVPYIDRLIPRSGAAGRHFSVVLLFGIGLATLAEALGVHFMIGAFLAGLLVTHRTLKSGNLIKVVEEKMSGVTLGFLAPIFFVSIGLHLDISAFTSALNFTLAILGAAVVGKLIGCSLPARLRGISWRKSIAIGFGMNGRGAVELVVASIALQAGLFSLPDPTPPTVAAMFSAVVIMAIVTTLMAPIGLRYLLKARHEADSE